MSDNKIVNTIHCKLDDGGFITRTDQIPWTRLNKPGLEGIQYKILNFDENRRVYGCFEYLRSWLAICPS